MQMFARLAVSVVFLTACSSSSGEGSPAPLKGDAGSTAARDAAADSNALGESGPTGPVTEHGVIIDYGTYLSNGTLMPVQGLTITDGNQSTTSDAQGNWSLTMPANALLAPVVSGTVKGDKYSSLQLPQATASASDVDRGNIIIPDSTVFGFEEGLLSADMSQGVIHVVAEATGSCTSVAGGTITVTSPAGAKVMYFNTKGTPDKSVTSFEALTEGKPVADIFDVPPGSEITMQVSHPTCKQAPFPVTYTGQTLNGKVATLAAEPGDNNSALLVVLK
jgi:hypothetical protein